MVRKLKFHEQKLLKKVDFLNVCYVFLSNFPAHRLQWKQDANLREIKVMRRYHIQDREDYHKYNRLCGVRPRHPLSFSHMTRTVTVSVEEASKRQNY